MMCYFFLRHGEVYTYEIYTMHVWQLSNKIAKY